MKESNKQLKKGYQQTPRAMGIFLIRNNRSDKVLVVAGVDLHGAINRHKFQLNSGGHANRELQTDWTELGSDNFAFEIVDELTPRPETNLDYRAELTSLEDLWLEKLQPFADRGYNLPKLSRAEKLQRIASKRSADS